MNPRLFCRERTFHKSLLLTYSFDPVFFEQVVLPDLWAGRSGDILVIGDREQINASTQAAAGQLWHLGKHYLLAGANHAGSFHPKILLRLGANDGAIMIGSGNITSLGWGGNQEVGTAWMLGPDHADNGAWLHPFLDDVMSWCSGELERDAVRRMKDVPWLSLTATQTATSSPVLHSRQAGALAPMLAQRWAGRQFDEVKILTGSTDESGAFLRWANTTFGIKRAVVALTPAMASFIPEKLADLPIELSLIAAPSDRPLHAKFYWFDGPTGPGAIMGSANCSAAAWLLPPNNRGNVETVIVYDAPNAEEFESVLNIFDTPGQAPAELLVAKSSVTDEQPAIGRDYDLMGLRWDDEARRLLAVIVPTPPPDSSVEVVLRGKPLTMTHLDGYWKCEIPEGIGTTTAFAFARLRRGEEILETLPRWIDDLAALRHASQSARLLEPFKGLERSATSAEQRQMLDELQEVAQALFNDAASFRDPGFGGRQDSKAKDERPVAPVNPSDLICHLEESPESLKQLGAARPGTLSLTGILRMLFDAEGDDGSTSVAAHDEQLDEGQIPDASQKPNPKKKSESEDPSKESAPIETRYRERLEAQLELFLSELSSSEFANRCTATQMVQAVSFPLAVALRGQKRGWVTAGLAEKWGLAVFSILFRGKGPKSGGLLHTVEERYAQNDQLSTFRDVVGDGTLWMVLVATLGNSQWHGVGAFIDKAIALREVFTSSQLLASAQPERIAGLLGKIRIEDARTFLAKVAPAVTDLLGKIDDLLRPIWEQDMRAQMNRLITHKAGDLLWRENIGWAVCLAEARTKRDQHIKVRLRGTEKQVVGGFYVNVTDLADRNPVLANLINDVRTRISESA